MVATRNISEVAAAKAALNHELNGYIYVVMSGQSNAVGNEMGGDLTVDQNVEVWNISTSQWETAISANVHGGTVLDGYNNIGWQFCKILSKATGRKVRYVLSAAGGASITQWETTAAAQYVALKDAIVASGIPHIDYFLWHQGEADVSMDGTLYLTKLNAFITALQAESFWDRFSLFLAGQLKQSGGQNARNNEINTLEGNDDNSLVVVDSGGLVDELDSHFTGAQMDIFGKRFYHKITGQSGMLRQLFLKISSISGGNDNSLIRMNGSGDIQGSSAIVDDTGHMTVNGYVRAKQGSGFYIGTVEVQNHDGTYHYLKGNIYTQGAVRFSDAQLYMLNLPVYADNAAAVAGGLAVNRCYKTSAGELRIVV